MSIPFKANGYTSKRGHCLKYFIFLVSLSLVGGSYKRKEFAHKEFFSFPFRVQLFSEENRFIRKPTGVTKVVSLWKNGENYTNNLSHTLETHLFRCVMQKFLIISTAVHLHFATPTYVPQCTCTLILMYKHILMNRHEHVYERLMQDNWHIRGYEQTWKWSKCLIIRSSNTFKRSGRNDIVHQ